MVKKPDPIAMAAMYLDIVDGEAVVTRDKKLCKKVVKTLKKFCKKNKIEIPEETLENYSIKIVDVKEKSKKEKPKLKKDIKTKKSKKINKEKLKEKRKKLIKKLKKMTLKELRSFAKDNEVPWYGTKDELYSRIKDHI